MEMIGHENVIAHLPCGSCVCPDSVNRSLNRGLSQPAFTFLCTNREKNPIGAFERKVNAFCRRAPTWVSKRDTLHKKQIAESTDEVKSFSHERSSGPRGNAALPDVGRANLPVCPDFGDVSLSSPANSSHRLEHEPIPTFPSANYDDTLKR